jgi:hypothetical protein
VSRFFRLFNELRPPLVLPPPSLCFLFYSCDIEV